MSIFQVIYKWPETKPSLRFQYHEIIGGLYHCYTSPLERGGNPSITNLVPKSFSHGTLFRGYREKLKSNPYYNEQIFWDVSLKEFFENKLYNKRAKVFLIIQKPDLIPGCYNFKKLLQGALYFNDIICPLLDSRLHCLVKDYPLLSVIQRKGIGVEDEKKEDFCTRARLAASMFPFYHVYVKPIYFTTSVFHILAFPLEKLSELSWDGELFKAKNPRVAFDNLVTKYSYWKCMPEKERTGIMGGFEKIKIP